MKKNNKKEESFFKKYGMFVIIIGLLIVFLVIMLTTGGNDKKQTKKVGEVSTMNVADWITSTKGSEVMVSVFAQTTCHYCEEFKPVVNEVIGEENIKIYWFEVDKMSQTEYNSLGETYSELKSFGTPYTIITKDGKKIGEVSGYVEKASLISKLKETGAIK